MLRWSRFPKGMIDATLLYRPVLVALKGSFLLCCWHKHCQSVSIINWNWLTCQGVDKGNKQYTGIIQFLLPTFKHINCQKALHLTPFSFVTLGITGARTAPCLTAGFEIKQAGEAARKQQLWNYRADIQGALGTSETSTWKLKWSFLSSSAVSTDSFALQFSYCHVRKKSVV